MLTINTDNLSAFVIDYHASIIDAVRLIESNNKKTAVVTRQDFFYGVLADGDVRKSIIHDISPHSLISPFVNRNPIVLRPIDDIAMVDTQLLLRLFDINPWISLVPVVTSSNRLLAVAYIY